MANDPKDTLNLPKTGFPMRGDLVKREPERIKHWEKMDLYAKIHEKNKKGETFILHDGPPFTNGDVHIGTALNKILKDIILKYKGMRGFHSPYIPGWDCHGLPIEHKVSRQLQEEKKTLTTAELREACADFSRSYMEKQRNQFKRLGILADWKNEYITMAPGYEAVILRTFAKFVENDLVYRNKKPVYWSIPCATALAEAEIEYKEISSPSIWVKFEVAPGEKLFRTDKSVYFVIWTTTPWTLPANLGIAVNPEFTYVEIECGNDSYIVAEKLAETFINDCNLENATIVNKYEGRSLEYIKVLHPFIDRSGIIMLADYVTADSGTGCVHTAPGHGIEDYQTGLKYGLEIYSPIDDNGCYLDDCQVPEELVGLSVLEKQGGSEANKKVLSILSEKGALLQAKKIVHSYPHCWRSKTAVIFRAMDQWFVALDKNGTRIKALEEISKVSFIPAFGENRIRGAVESRPDWCISRQRAWGVPIPVFYDEDKEVYIDASVISAIADKVEKQGTNIWFEQSAAEILKGIKLPSHWNANLLQKGTDTLDVWIDSGCSHRVVLQNNPDLRWPADLYLEGSDQHRGWFQSSLWTAVVADGSAPYKQIITHGFIVGQDGKKISKSDGKPLTADLYVNKYGTDIIRLWLSSEDYRMDIPISDEILNHVAQTYRTIRNTLRFQLSNLYDFSEKDAVPVNKLSALDQWALKYTAALIEECTQAYDNYEFHKVYHAINRFCTTTLSAVYHSVLKDRLYTLAPNDPLRRSSQTTIKIIFEELTKLIAPILPFTADEVYSYAKNDSDFCDQNILLEAFAKADKSWYSDATVNEVEQILAFRDQVNEQLENLRKEKIIGQSLDAKVIIHGSMENPLYALLKKNAEHLEELFIVSQVSFSQTGDTSSPSVTAAHADGVRCPRCWRWIADLKEGELCPRCVKALSD